MTPTTKAAVIEALEAINRAQTLADRSDKLDRERLLGRALLAHLETVRAALRSEPTPEPGERERFEKALKQTWQMIDPLRPPPAGSYALGFDNGVAAALKTLRENYELAARASLPLAPEPVAGWRTIETAPKDGRTLLLGYFNSAGRWRTMRGQWMSQDYIDEYWEEPEGVDPWWFETVVESDDVPNCWPTEPTHWMPLPPAPTKGTA